uniref:Uncharacterized protein n=1 Tax=Photinus pyralis TaxID=7054 RepID=A0A1Y1MW76_PHOPY
MNKNDITDVYIESAVKCVRPLYVCVHECGIVFLAENIDALLNVKLNGKISSENVRWLRRGLEKSELCARLVHPLSTYETYGYEYLVINLPPSETLLDHEF